MIPRIARLCGLLALLLIAGCGRPALPERSLELVAVEMAFVPTELQANTNEQIFIRFRNEGSQAHNLTVELSAGDRAVSAEAGQDAILSIPPQPAGTYRMYCKIPGHEAQQATLVINP